MRVSTLLWELFSFRSALDGADRSDGRPGDGQYNVEKNPEPAIAADPGGLFQFGFSQYFP